MTTRLVSAATAALAAGLLATLLTGTADAATTPAAPTPPTAPSTTAGTVPTTSPTTSAPSTDRGVVVAVPRPTPATLSLRRSFPLRAVFSVSLYENPSTGYGWSQSVPTGSKGPVTLLDTDYVQDPTPTGATGVGGTRYFRYQVTSPGFTTITFRYRRPWETGIPPMQQVTLAVRAG